MSPGIDVLTRASVRAKVEIEQTFAFSKGSTMARALDPFPAPKMDELQSQAAALERRLDDGYRRIDDAALEGKDIAAWETFWIRLLRDYESVCDGLAHARAA